MNKWIGMGRLTRDPEIRTSAVGDNTICRFSLAVDRPWARDRENQQTADFINCICFGKTAEFMEKWFHKGDPIIVEGRIQTGSYTNKDGIKVYTTDIAVDRTEFVPKNGGNGEGATSQSGYGQRDTSEQRRKDDFVNIPDGVDDELPFN